MLVVGGCRRRFIKECGRDSRAILGTRRGSARLGTAGAPKEKKRSAEAKKKRGMKRQLISTVLCFASRRQHEEHVLADDTRQPLRGQHQRSHAEVGVLLHAGRGLGKPLRALRDRSVSTPADGLLLC